MILICLLVASHDYIDFLRSFRLVLYSTPHIQALKDPLILERRDLSRCFFPDMTDVSAHWEMRNQPFFPSRVQQTR